MLLLLLLLLRCRSQPLQAPPLPRRREHALRRWVRLVRWTEAR